MGDFVFDIKEVAVDKNSLISAIISSVIYATAIPYKSGLLYVEAKLRYFYAFQDIHNFYCIIKSHM